MEKKSNISIIVAVAENGAIGRGNDLIWHLSADLKFFKATTLGHPIIMGRRTFESIGRALPGRLNIVVSSSNPTLPEGVAVAGSLEEAVEMGRKSGEVFITGGGRIYAQAMDIADKIFLTRVYCSPSDADTFFPRIDPDRWTLTAASETATDEKSGLKYRFETWIRR